MRKLLHLSYLIALLLLITNHSFAQSIVTARLLNGHNWFSWSDNEKLGFVNGFISGSEWVASNSMVSEAIFPDDAAKQRSKTLWEEVNDDFGNAVRTPNTKLTPKYTSGDIFRYGIYDSYKKNDDFQRGIIVASSKSIIDGLNRLYSARENLKIRLGDAIYLVQKRLKGASAEDIEILLPYLRGEKQIPFLWMVPVYENGKVTKIIEFP